MAWRSLPATGRRSRSAFSGDGTRGRLTATAAAARGGRAEGVGVALARRVIDALGGGLTVTLDAGAATLTADLPVAGVDAGAEERARRA